MADWNQQVPAFRNIEPRSRDERLAGQQGGESLEKMRLRARGLNPPANIVTPIVNSPQYANEYQRFERDAAAQEQQLRLQKLNRKEEVYEQKRVADYHREQARWDHMQSNEQRYEQYMQQKREAGMGRNQSGEHYNILTLQHKMTAEGERLRQQDEHTMQRGELRTQNLFDKAHSVTHNIITGHPLYYPQPVSQRPAMPHQPVAPWDR